MSNLQLTLNLAHTLTIASAIVIGLSLLIYIFAYMVKEDELIRESTYETISDLTKFTEGAGVGLGILGLVCLYISFYVW